MTKMNELVDNHNSDNPHIVEFHKHNLHKLNKIKFKLYEHRKAKNIEKQNKIISINYYLITVRDKPKVFINTYLEETKLKYESMIRDLIEVRNCMNGFGKGLNNILKGRIILKKIMIDIVRN
jgi:hypothetical protein